MFIGVEFYTIFFWGLIIGLKFYTFFFSAQWAIFFVYGVSKYIWSLYLYIYLIDLFFKININ